MSSDHGSEAENMHEDHDDHEEHASHPHEEHEGGHDEPWLVSYADMMTLLFGFFVIMYSFASAKNDEDKQEWHKVKKEIAEYFGGEYVNPVNGIAEQVKKTIESTNLAGEVEVKVIGNTLELIMQSKMIFESGSAEVIESQVPLIEKLIAVLIEKKLDNYAIIVEGHTDDVPIYTLKFRSNWDLSAARASTVAMMLQEKKYDPKALSIRAYGEFKPAFPNRTEQGIPIPENQAKNRRIVVKLVASQE